MWSCHRTDLNLYSRTGEPTTIGVLVTPLVNVWTIHRSILMTWSENTSWIDSIMDASFWSLCENRLSNVCTARYASQNIRKTLHQQLKRDIPLWWFQQPIVSSLISRLDRCWINSWSSNGTGRCRTTTITLPATHWNVGTHWRPGMMLFTSSQHSLVWLVDWWRFWEWLYTDWSRGFENGSIEHKYRQVSWQRTELLRSRYLRVLAARNHMCEKMRLTHFLALRIFWNAMLQTTTVNCAWMSPSTETDDYRHQWKL